MSLHHERVQEALRVAAAEFLAREANRQSLITVTRTQVSDGGNEAIIFITVLPDTAEAAALKFANRHRSEFGAFFEKKVRGAHMPHVEFVIDRGEKMRQRLDELTN